MRSLLIDDCRSFSVSVIARNYFEGVRQLQLNGPWDHLYLDHDLGGMGNDSFCPVKNREMTGYDVMCWLEEHPEFLPAKITLVTDNPVGRQKMQTIIDRLYHKE